MTELRESKQPGGSPPTRSRGAAGGAGGGGAGTAEAEGAAGSGREPRRRDVRAAVLLAMAALLVYNVNLRTIATGDSLPARFIPFAVWKAGTVRLDPVLEATRQQHPDSYWIQRARDGGHASMYPIVAPLLVTPLYAPAAFYLMWHGWPEKSLEVVGEVMEKIAASCVAAAASGLMFLLLRQRMRFGPGLLLAIAFAVGTETWVIGSQALWQHGAAELLLVAALLAVTGPPTTTRLVVAGLACGLVIGDRPLDLPLAGAIALFAPLWAGRRAGWFMLAAGLPVALLIVYNLTTFGEIAGGYEMVAKQARYPYFLHPIGRGMVEMLFSPGKGLFPFTPFLLFVPFCLGRVLKVGVEPLPAPESWPRWRPLRWALAGRDRALAVCLLAGILTQVVLYGPTEWRGGSAYGPRFLTDMLPMAIWLLGPVVESLRGAGLALFVAAVTFSTAVQAIGAFCYPRGGSDVRINVEHSSMPGYLIEAAAGPIRPSWLDSILGPRPPG
ncbi:MAG TPA: hypothetical protein VE075_05925 [Thermoanaerobaculia bacterium]|nr:hypothetical protein [Thermoanaerobaculia bacterium]